MTVTIALVTKTAIWQGIAKVSVSWLLPTATSIADRREPYLNNKLPLTITMPSEKKKKKTQRTSDSRGRLSRHISMMPSYHQFPPIFCSLNKSLSFLCTYGYTETEPSDLSLVQRERSFVASYAYSVLIHWSNKPIYRSVRERNLWLQQKVGSSLPRLINWARPPEVPGEDLSTTTKLELSERQHHTFC